MMLPRSKNGAGILPSSRVVGRPSRVFPRILTALSCFCIFLATCSDQPSEPEQIPVVQLNEREATLLVPA